MSTSTSGFGGLGSGLLSSTRALGDATPNGLGLVAAALLGKAPDVDTRIYPCFESYLDKAGEWRWRFKASNYKTLADSGEGYQNYADLIHAINLLKGCFASPIYIGER